MEIQIQIVEQDNELVVLPKNLTFPPAVGGLRNKYELVVKNSTLWNIHDFSLNFGDEAISLNIPTDITPNGIIRGELLYTSQKKLQPDVRLQLLVSMSADQLRG